MKQNVKRIALLGATGSIGQNSLAVIDSLGDEFKVVAASANCQWAELARQARQYNLKKVVVCDLNHKKKLQEALNNTSTQVLAGPDSLVELAEDNETQVVIVAIVGASALPAVLAATRAGKTVAIANKESLVAAGCLLMPLAERHSAKILPIDSEHSAIMQAMHAGRRCEVEKIIITASGGPFRTATIEQMAKADIDQALSHPTWQMGPKITIDSATMMNKALEIVEARWLFDLRPEQIEVLIHPESIIHSMVEFCDGSVIAQMSRPDMRLPIQYALTYPERKVCETKSLDLHKLKTLSFEEPDLEKFGAIRLGFKVAQQGGTAGAVLNAANEAAVEAFLTKKIKLTQITELTEECLNTHEWVEKPNLEQLLNADKWAREYVKKLISQNQKPKQLQIQK